MNWDTAAAQSASKTEQMSKKKAALLKDIQDIDKTLETIPGAELWGQSVSLYSQLKWSEYLVEHFKGSNKDVVSVKTRYQAANRLLEALPAEDFKRIKELDAKRFDLMDSWPTAELPAGINCEGYCLSLEPFKNRKSILNAATTARQESEAKGLSLKDTNSSIKKALVAAIKRQSGENKAKFSEPKPIREFQFTTEEAKAQFKTWWNLSKMNHNMSDLSTEAGIIEKLEKDGFPVDEIKGDPQFRRRVATCYKTTGNAWSCQ